MARRDTQAGGHAPVDPVAAARALAPRVAAAAEEIERGRRLPAALAREFAAAGLFGMLVPREFGGLEAPPDDLVDAVAEIARADGSAGWCTMIAATSAALAAWLPPAAARAVYGTPGVVTGGVFHPRGRAVEVDGGWRLSGRWPFASGCENCDWLMGGGLVFPSPDAARPALRDDGTPRALLFLFPAGQARILDTWSTSGLRGSGSHDIEVEDLFVPADRAAWLADPPVHPGPLYRFPVFGLLALGIAGVALGIARGAIEDLVAIAGEKIPTGGRRPIAARAAVQADLARAEAAVRGGRALVREAIAEAWQAARSERPVEPRTRGLLRLAATDAVRRCADAVDRMYEAAGASAIHDRCPLQRRFRDIHVATQHVMVASPTFEVAGRVLLGLDVGGELL